VLRGGGGREGEREKEGERGRKREKEGERGRKRERGREGQRKRREREDLRGAWCVMRGRPWLRVPVMPCVLLLKIRRGYHPRCIRFLLFLYFFYLFLLSSLPFLGLFLI
jgi:hypothetical protein